MKKIVLISIMTFFIMSCSQKQNENITFIKGEILSGKAKEVTLEWSGGNPISETPNTFTAVIDSNSNFSIEIPIERITYGRIRVGSFYHTISLIPDDDFFISIDADSIKYSGKGAEKNNFLYQTEINGFGNGAYYRKSNIGELTPVDFLDTLTNFKQKRIKFLESYVDSVMLQKEFVELYKIETEVIFENLIRGYPRKYSYRTKIPQDSLELPEEFIKLNIFSNYVDDSKVVCSVYINELRNQLIKKAREITLSDTSIKMKDAIYSILFDSLSGKTREYVLTKWIITEFSQDRYDSVAIKKFNKIERGELAQNTFTLGLNKFNEKRSLIGQPLHQEFSNTLLKDTSNVQFAFGEMMEKYKGKVVYLDFWSMGCGPCIAAMPYAKKLKEKLKDEPIEFVYASVKRIKNNNWGKVFELTFTNKNHYVLENGWNSRLNKFMEIFWVPSYMIFDKEGKLIDFNADRPSRMVESGETELEKILKDLASK